LAIVTGKKIGDANRRNRVRRQIREIARSLWKDLAQGWDLVIVTKKTVVEADFQDLRGEFLLLAQKAGLFS